MLPTSRFDLKMLLSNATFRHLPNAPSAFALKRGPVWCLHYHNQTNQVVDCPSVQSWLDELIEQGSLVEGKLTEENMLKYVYLEKEFPTEYSL